MKFTYESTLDDVVEPSVRLFVRSKTYATHRWRGAAIWGVAFAVFAAIGFRSKPDINLPLICVAAAAWGAGLTLLTYKGSVRRRIAKYVKTELPGGWPRITDYEITDDKLTGTTSGVSLTFNLADLTAVTEDAKFLELTFGTKGLCTIPLRAFSSAEEKAAFLAAIHHPPAA